MSESFTCSLQVIKWFYIYYLIFKSSWQPHVEESAVIIIPILQIRKMGLSGNPTRKIKLRINVLCPKQKLKGPRSQEQMHILLRTLNLSCKSSLWVSEGTSQWYIHWMQKICRLGSGVFKPADCGCFAQKRCRAHSVPSYKKEPEKAEKIGKEDNTGPLPACFALTLHHFCGGESGRGVRNIWPVKDLEKRNRLPTNGPFFLYSPHSSSLETGRIRELSWDLSFLHEAEGSPRMQ